MLVSNLSNRKRQARFDSCMTTYYILAAIFIERRVSTLSRIVKLEPSYNNSDMYCQRTKTSQFKDSMFLYFLCSFKDMFHFCHTYFLYYDGQLKGTIFLIYAQIQSFQEYKSFKKKNHIAYISYA